MNPDLLAENRLGAAFFAVGGDGSGSSTSASTVSVGAGGSATASSSTGAASGTVPTQRSCPGASTACPPTRPLAVSGVAPQCAQATATPAKLIEETTAKPLSARITTGETHHSPDGSPSFRFSPSCRVLLEPPLLDVRRASRYQAMTMTIAVGDRVPSLTLKHLVDGGLADITTDEVFKGKKVLLFSLPGAYTPTCSAEHLPGFVAKADEIRAAGVDDIVCLSVNDPWVMHAWGEAHGAQGKVTMLPDGNGALTRALGIEADMSAASLGERGKRCSLVIEDAVVKEIQVEPGRGVTVSGADACLINLK